MKDLRHKVSFFAWNTEGVSVFLKNSLLIDFKKKKPSRGCEAAFYWGGMIDKY